MSDEEVCKQLEEAKETISGLRKQLQRAKHELAKLYEDNRELARKCKEHYDNCQNLLRYELRVAEGERVANGTVASTGAKFVCGGKK